MDGADWLFLPFIGAVGLFAAGITGFFLGAWGALAAFGGVVLISLVWLGNMWEEGG